METIKSNRWIGTVLFAAVVASLCCITPVLAVLGGLSGIASTFSFLDPLRPYFIGFTVIVLGFAFYNAYKLKKSNEIDCKCEPESKKSFIISKSFLWFITIVAIVLISFPYYSQVFFPNSQNNVVTNNAENIVKAKLEIEGMTCTGCEESVNYALKEETGVVNAASSYETGIAYVEYDSAKVDAEQLKRTVEDKVGYKVKTINVKD